MKKIFFALLLTCFATLSNAFFPQNGTWLVSAENNGQPGRGFTIQNQAGTMIILFYGYSANGQANWYLTAGHLTDSNTFSGTFQTYAGGMAFGGAATQAAQIGTAGTVTVVFTSSTQGTMTLPGEQPKTISWANFGDPNPATSLTGTYVLMRGAGVDALGNISSSATTAGVTGLLQINGTTATETLTVPTSTGQSTTTTSGTIVDSSSSFVFTNSSTGTQSVYQVLERGDNLVIFTTGSGGSVSGTRWYRVSPSGTYVPTVIQTAD